MTRFNRFLSTVNTSSTTTSSAASATAAEPPEQVAVESDYVVILAALLCALICVVGLIAVVRCAWLRRGTSGNGRSASFSSANKGLKKKIVQSLPRFTYNAAEKGKGGADCAICLSEYADGEEIRMLPQCGHGFHLCCIDTWLASHSSCPSCRQVLVVARCKKCGEFPSVSGVGGQIQKETELKTRQAGAGPSGYLP